MEDNKKQFQESFGIISISRVSSTGRKLLGSDLLHQAYFSLEISQCSVSDFYGNPRPYPQQDLIRVSLTQTQLMQLFTNMNTLGNFCTIDRLMGKGLDYTPLPNKLDVYREKVHSQLEGNERVDKYKSDLQTMISELKISKKKKEELLRNLGSLCKVLSQNAKFYGECFQELTDDIVSDAKANIEAYVLNKNLPSKMVSLEDASEDVLKIETGKDDDR